MASKYNPKTCPMCTQAMAFNSSLNNQLTCSVLISQKKRPNKINYLNIFVSTKARKGEKPENVGGTAYSINFCPWCGRDLNEEEQN